VKLEEFIYRSVLVTVAQRQCTAANDWTFCQPRSTADQGNIFRWMSTSHKARARQYCAYNAYDLLICAS